MSKVATAGDVLLHDCARKICKKIGNKLDIFLHGAALMLANEVHQHHPVRLGFSPLVIGLKDAWYSARDMVGSAQPITERMQGHLRAVLTDIYGRPSHLQSWDALTAAKIFQKYFMSLHGQEDLQASRIFADSLDKSARAGGVEIRLNTGRFLKLYSPDKGDTIVFDVTMLKHEMKGLEL